MCFSGQSWLTAFWWPTPGEEQRVCCVASHTWRNNPLAQVSLDMSSGRGIQGLKNLAVYASFQIVLFLSCFWPLICRDKLRLCGAWRFKTGLPIPPGQDLLIQLSILSRHCMQDGAEWILLLVRAGSEDGWAVHSRSLKHWRKLDLYI